jgi:signal transduction histidine kinase
MDYSRLFVEKARSPRAQAFKVKGQLEIIRDTLKNITDAHAIDVEIDVAPQVVGPHVPIAAYNGITTNLISNALKALVPKVSKQRRRVRVHAFNENQMHHLIVSDNGIGIPEHLRDRIWDPLYTTTATDDNPLGSGLGLGLTLVQRVIKNLSGKIDLLNEAPPGFVTAFRVTLPL